MEVGKSGPVRRQGWKKAPVIDKVTALKNGGKIGIHKVYVHLQVSKFGGLYGLLI
jgi:hypothetical protein